MSNTPSISVERIDRKVYEAETDGLVVILTQLDDWERIKANEVNPIHTAYDCLCIDGDGEKSYNLFVVAKDADMVTEIRAFVTEKLKGITSRVSPYFIVEREQERKRVLRSLPLIRTRQANSNEYIVTADDLVFTFVKDTSAQRTQGGVPYYRFTYSEAAGELSGAIEVVGDHTLLYEFAPIVETHLKIRAARKQLRKEMAENG